MNGRKSKSSFELKPFLSQLIASLIIVRCNGWNYFNYKNYQFNFFHVIIVSSVLSMELCISESYTEIDKTIHRKFIKLKYELKGISGVNNKLLKKIISTISLERLKLQRTDSNEIPLSINLQNKLVRCSFSRSRVIFDINFY